MKTASKSTVREYRIALVNNASRSNPEHWAPVVSKRRVRAIKQARALRDAGNPNVILFADLTDGSSYAVSLR